MSEYADLSPCRIDGTENEQSILAIGWLGGGTHFTVGDSPIAVYESLVSLFKDCWQPFVTMGVHGCNLCQFEPGAVGRTILLVPGDGILFACPELITHYINSHYYCPPREFCNAVLGCPSTRSMEYKRKLLANGGRGILRGLHDQKEL